MPDITNNPTSPDEPDLRDWTVMVYMAAGDSAKLDSVAVRDLREMERGTNENIHVVVQINRHWPDSIQRYRVEAGGSVTVGPKLTETNMAKPETLQRFLTWAVKAFPAKRYFLILWGHAFGLGFGRDHNDALTLKDLQKALIAFRDERKQLPKDQWGDLDGPLDLLGANACAMSYVEAAYELRECAQYMVASQITVPFAGWPYESILSRLAGTTTPDAVGRLVVDTYVSQFDDLPGADRLAMTLLNLEASTKRKLNDLVDGVAVAIRDEVNGKTFNNDRLAFYRDIFIGAPAGDVRPLIDLVGLCNDLTGDADDPIPGDVSKAASALRDSVTTSSSKGKPLIAYHRKHPELQDLNGVGVFAPFVTDEETLKRLELQDTDLEKRTNGRTKVQETGKQLYKRLDLFGPLLADGQPTGKWPSLVYDVLRRDIPADLMVSIDGIGAMQRGDRADVAQIILAIDSSLNKLDRTLANAKHGIASEFAANGEASNEKGRAKSAAKGKTQASNGKNGKYSERSFGPPWLRLVQPLDFETRVEALKRLIEFNTLNRKAPKQNPIVEAKKRQLVTSSVTWFGRVEDAVSEVERTTRRGLTHARFGLGPLSPTQFNLGTDPPKPGEGIDPPKPGEGIDPPKPGEGEVKGNGVSAVGGDLRGDLALARVADLFRRVGQSLRQLEQATNDAENAARTILVDSTPADGNSYYFFEAAALEMERAFHVLEEASTSTRRTVRRVLAHPIYGLGPGSEGDLTLDAREELASRGGLDKRHLRLL